MKRMICLIYFLSIMIALSACSVQPEPTEPVEYSIEEVIDTCYTPPDTYEICYRTTFSNGLIIDRWTMVTKEEYEREVEE